MACGWASKLFKKISNDIDYTNTSLVIADELEENFKIYEDIYNILKGNPCLSL